MSRKNEQAFVFLDKGILINYVNNGGFAKSPDYRFLVIPAKAGIQFFCWFWTPVFTGVTGFFTEPTIMNGNKRDN